uniref:Peptidase M61 catalytic domain-containing protein n=1 Tax=uncultured Acidobacteriota bacterium TaxID=171953 RepID=Q7X315_9BACT|nr:hypothetical protein [uncultured Acidobacteriota bacterium]
MPSSTVKEHSAHFPSPKAAFRQSYILAGHRSLVGASLARIRSSRNGICALLALFFVCAISVTAQTLKARISVVSSDPAKVRVDLEFPAPATKISIRNSYGGALGLAERIELIEGTRQAQQVEVRKKAPGEFDATEKFDRISYYVNATQPLRPGQLAQISWLDSQQGLLLLSDLIPYLVEGIKVSSAEVELNLPAGWSVESNAVRINAQTFVTRDVDKAVFVLAPKLRRIEFRGPAPKYSLINVGKWPFSEKDAVKLIQRFLDEYERVTEFKIKDGATVMLLPFPGDVGPENWSAETRGDTVVLFVGNKEKKKRVLSRLGIALSHELFHLWVPNSLDLEGDYDWFFEGFTLYQALRSDLRLGLISFENYLQTIARLYESYRVSPDRDRMSLIEASERRWSSGTSSVYEKGMLVAFMYDLMLKDSSNCAGSFNSLYRELFRLPPARHRNANETIISLLNGRVESRNLTAKYVEGKEPIDLERFLSAYALELRTEKGKGTLRSKKEATQEQRKFFRCIEKGD